MSKYRVLREMPGFKVGNYYDAEDLSYFNGITIRNFKKKHLIEEGWIEEVKEKDLIKEIKEALIEHSSWMQGYYLEVAKSHYKEKVLRAFDQYAEYSFRERETKGEIRKSIEQAFEE